MVTDGREKRRLNLGVFNPVWMMRDDRLSNEEVVAVASHLSHTVFTSGSNMSLDIKTIEWLVSAAEVQNRSRCTQPGMQEPDERDLIYHSGAPTDRCTLVLQGRLGLRVGRGNFRSEAGAFTVLAK